SMTDSPLREQIARLEAETERLSDSAARCRKIAVAAKAALGAGGVVLASLLVGAIGIDGLSLMIAAILIIGGIVLLGSNATTLKKKLARNEENHELAARVVES